MARETLARLRRRRARPQQELDSGQAEHHRRLSAAHRQQPQDPRLPASSASTGLPLTISTISEDRARHRWPRSRMPCAGASVPSAWSRSWSARSTRSKQRAPAMASETAVRIIGGAWRSRLLDFPMLRTCGPTPDRVRETLFNWLGQDLTGEPASIFSPAAARSASRRLARRAQVVMVERDAAVIRALRSQRDDACRPTQVELVRADALEFPASDDAPLRRRVPRPAVPAQSAAASLAPARPRCLAPDARVYARIRRAARACRRAGKC